MTLLLVSLLACAEPPAAPSTPAGVPTTDEIDADVDEGVAHVLGGGRRKWSATWSGDLSGETGGTVFTVQKIMMNTSLAGGALAPDMKGRAPQALVASLQEVDGAWHLSNLTLTLPDETRCGVRDTMPTATVTDAEKKTFTGTFTGSLVCGEGRDKAITFEVRVDADPG